MWTRQLRDSMPPNIRQVQVVNLLAINVDLEAVTEMRDPLNNWTFCSVALVQEWRNNREANLLLRNVHKEPAGIISQLRVSGHRPAASASFSSVARLSGRDFRNAPFAGSRRCPRQLRQPEDDADKSP
jgi:hypothetical protein